MADSVRSATPQLPSTTSTPVSSSHEIVAALRIPTTLDRFSVPMIVRPHPPPLERDEARAARQARHDLQHSLGGTAYPA
jgi:hypothetical protein